jgi:hypothetical protein
MGTFINATGGEAFLGGSGGGEEDAWSSFDERAWFIGNPLFGRGLNARERTRIGGGWFTGEPIPLFDDEMTPGIGGRTGGLCTEPVEGGRGVLPIEDFTRGGTAWEP